jgi:hypothetical protein
MTSEYADRFLPALSIRRSGIDAVTTMSGELPIAGTVTTSVHIRNQAFPIEFVIVDLPLPHGDGILIGDLWLRAHRRVLGVDSLALQVPRRKITATVAALQKSTDTVDHDFDREVDLEDMRVVAPVPLSQDVQDLLREYHHVTDTSFKVAAKVEPMRIDIKPDARPVLRQPFRENPVRQAIINAKVDELLRLNIAKEDPDATWVAPVLLAAKPGSTDLRLCMSYTDLNAATVPIQFPLPRIDYMLDRLSGCDTFTKLDAKSGYWQITDR